MDFKDLDYFRTKDDIFFLVKGYYHPAKKVFAYPVFWPDKKGDRFHQKLKKTFKKDTSDIDNAKIFKLYPHYRHNFIPQNIPLVPQNEIVEIFRPQEKIKDFFKNERRTIWFKVYQSICQKGKIPSRDLGIFGSYLVGLSKTSKGKQVKDIDFAVYGVKNCQKLKNNIGKILESLKAKPISKDHVAYHAQKFGSKFNPRFNSFKKTLSRKWSALQLKKGLLSTIRCVYKDYEIPPNPIIFPIKHHFQIEGKVLDDFGTNFMPRTFSIQKNNKKYNVITYFWGFQEAVKNKDLVLITGNLHQDEKTISIDDIGHGIKILN